MARVALESVSKTFAGNPPAVDDITLEVQDREFLVLVGPSGCGKSTTLRLIAGLEQADTGRIEIGERMVNHTPPKDRNIAMVFQNYALYPHMTVADNMAFGLRLRYGGWWKRIWRYWTDRARAREFADRRKEIPQQVGEAARTLGIEALLSRLPRQLSGGERQRVALGRAIVRRPDAFLFDEPLSNLDAKLRGEMRREIKRLHLKLEATMVYVTHDQVEALTLGDRVVVMDRGRIQQVGRPMELYDRPQNRFVAGFIGSPSMSFFEGELQKLGGDDSLAEFRGGGLRLRFSECADLLNSARVSDSRLPVHLGVRPEDVRISPWRGEVSHQGESQPENAGKVVLLELLGESAMIHVETAAGIVVVCRSDGRTSVQVGEMVELAVDPPRVHWFDPATGERLGGRSCATEVVDQTG
ncbi:ABC transporter ATP-binding protein [Lignipirellula cremea]|uniref:ABC transporter ATP-binding protein n=1 Tax=Lignipirellula cremea TaxID=2528010 RepID=UPI0011A4EE66|nr:ABC transporter ATP-binding protein [Lignipirellula cremea]